MHSFRRLLTLPGGEGVLLLLLLSRGVFVCLVFGHVCVVYIRKMNKL